jgi:hypothetical protein
MELPAKDDAIVPIHGSFLEKLRQRFPGNHRLLYTLLQGDAVCQNF